MPCDVGVLRVVDAGRVDGDDVSFLDAAGVSRRGARARERGFAGTALAGLPPVVATAGEAATGKEEEEEGETMQEG